MVTRKGYQKIGRCASRSVPAIVCASTVLQVNMKGFETLCKGGYCGSSSGKEVMMMDRCSNKTVALVGR